MITTLDFIAPIFVPANRPEIFRKALLSDADAIIFDLEDAVPSPQKEAARANLPGNPDRLPILVRVNGIHTPWFARDVEKCLEISPAAIVVPKVNDPSDLEPLCRLLSTKSVPVVALIESARGIANARSIGTVAAVARLAFGSLDYCADLGCKHTREALLSARSELVLASRLCGLSPPLDGVTPKTDDPDLVHEDARHGAMLGFGGKLCIHPSQVGPIKAGFRPDAAEVEWANRILAAGDDGVTAVDGAMVDEPIRACARRVLAREQALRG